MKKYHYLILFFIINILAQPIAHSVQSDFFDQGKQLFKKKEYEKSKIFFERDIVFNPKSEMSYLYLGKIYEKIENDEESEKNLNSVLMLNPTNEEAIYILTLLRIKQSDYNGTKELLDRFNLVCKSLCNKKTEINNKFEKLIPLNEKDNN